MTINNETIEAILNEVLGATAFAAPATTYIGLVTDGPIDDGSGYTEVTGGSYARVTKTNNVTNWPACVADSREKTNGTTITFPTPTAPWGSVVGVIITFDAVAGNAKFYGEFADPETINTGNVFSFGVGQLKVRAL